MSQCRRRANNFMDSINNFRKKTDNAGNSFLVSINYSLYINFDCDINIHINFSSNNKIAFFQNILILIPIHFLQCLKTV